jgi:TonB-dependent starch-binding outer membrane protein SusC
MKKSYELGKGICHIPKKLLLVMKLTAFLIILLTMHVSASVYSQNTKLSINMQGTTIKEVLQQIEAKSEFRFIYENEKVNLDDKVNIQVTDEVVENILKKLFDRNEATYTINENNLILINPSSSMSKNSAGNMTGSQQQQLSISGKVTDSAGSPLPGVSVVLKGTTTGTITDADGIYKLTNVAGKATLQFSFVGMKALEISVAGKTTINATLTDETIGLEEVVAVGYGVQKKVNLTGAVSSIGVTQLADKPVATTSQALAGLVPGLSVVQNSGRPGTSASVKIRGTGTFSTAGNDPLVLIDGMAGGLDDVDPSNIENISFLKDAASASIYGNRAANGVILITTKRGTEGKIKISYDNTLGWQKPTELPDFLPSWEYATYYNEAMSNMGKAASYTDAQIQKYKDGSDPDNYPNVNHLKWLINSGSGFQQRHTLGIQGGTAALTYNFSVGYSGQEGMTAKTSNDRYNVLWNMKSKLTNTLTLNTNLNAYTNTFNSPNGEPTSIDGMVGFTVREGPIYAGKKSDGSFGYQDNYSPEAWLSSTSFIKNIAVNVIGTAQLQWETPIKGLSLSGKAGITYNDNKNKSYRAATYFDASKTVGPATLSMNFYGSTYKTLEGLVTYARKINVHSINVLLGSSRETYTYRTLTGGRNTFPNNYLYELTSGAASSATNDGSMSEWALVSFFGRANYSFNDRYLLEANVRYDGSSRFSSANRWGVFPSFSAGWRISEENFWKNSGITRYIDNMKVRGSWGVLGNQNIGTYPYQQVYALGQNAVIGNPGTLISGARVTTLNNPDVTWETTRVTDFGLDFSLFKGKITGVFDYFDKYTDNILSSVQVTKIIGKSIGQSNVGAVSNKGVEINLTYNGKIGKDFRFAIAPNFTYVKNAVEKLADGALTDINNNRIVGEPLGIIYGYTTDGLFVDQAEIDAAETQLVGKASLKPGYVRYVDISGSNGTKDGLVNANYDRSVIGCTTPKYYYGLNLSASYKGFDFSALLQGLGGYQRLIGSYMAYAFYNGGQIQRWQVENRWTTSNPDKWAKYPRLETLNMNNTNLQTSTYWLRNASFLRVKNVQIGYTFPKALMQKIGIENLRVFASGQNLFNFTSFYKGWDPENEIATGDAPSFYPINSIYSFGLNVKF